MLRAVVRRLDKKKGRERTRFFFVRNPLCHKNEGFFIRLSTIVLMPPQNQPTKTLSGRLARKWTPGRRQPFSLESGVVVVNYFEGGETCKKKRTQVGF